MATTEGGLLDEGYTTIAGAPKDGPVLTMMSKRLRALKKKYNRILQIEDSKAHGKTINREQEEVLKTKIAVTVLIDEYEKLRQPLQMAVKEEIAERERELMSANLRRHGSEDESVENDKESDIKEEVQKEVVNGDINEAQENSEQIANDFSNETEISKREIPEAETLYPTEESDDKPSMITNEIQKENHLRVYGEETAVHESLSEEQIADLVNLLYFARLFDVRSEEELLSIVWTKVHERSSCLSYDFVFDDATAPLTEGDLDALSKFASLLTTRPPNATISHKEALHQCIQHARLWLSNSNEPINSDLQLSYTGLRERLSRILSSEYFIMTPELQTVTPQTVAAATTAASQHPSQVYISDARIDNQISEVEEPSVHLAPQPPSKQHKAEGENVCESFLPTASDLPVEDPILTGNVPSDPSESVNDSQHVQENEGQMTRLGEEAKVQRETTKPSTPIRQRQQYNPRYNGGGNRGGGYQGARDGGRGYGYGMGSRGRGYATGRGNRGSRGYPYGRGQYYDQGGYYARNTNGGRNGRGGHGGFVNGYENGTSRAVVTGQA